MKKLLLTTAFAYSLLSAQAQIITSPINNDSLLVNYLQGYGLTISNMNINAYPGSLAFYSGSSPMAFGSGVIMSTGIVDSTINDSVSYFLNGTNGGNSDADLNLLCGQQTYDACVIEFDCVPAYSNIEFDFAFGSEEYNEFVGSFNDIFAILLTGPDSMGGTSTQNLAVIPGTSTPVSVNNVNNGMGGPTGAGQGPCTNCQYYYDNVLNNAPVALDGFTTGLLGTALVVPGQSYHFKIAIADAGDQAFDSQVMFLTNSFRSMAPVGIKEADQQNAIGLYPNPAKGKFTISAKGVAVDKVELSTIDGKPVNAAFDRSSGSVNTENLAKGMYLVSIYSNGEKLVKKIVVE